MKHLKLFENWGQDPSIKQITIRDLAEFIDNGELPYLVAIKEKSGQPSLNREIDVVTPQEFSSIVDPGDKIILIDENAFDSIPASLKNRCSLLIVDGEIPSAIMNRLQIFSMPY